MAQTQSDPTIDEIREVRHRISAQFDHDPARLVAYYMELQKQYQANLASEREIRSKLQVSENREGRIRKELEMIVSSIDDIVVEFESRINAGV